MATIPVKYFANIFAAQGDVASVPDAGSQTGSMSYEYGYPVNYSRVLGTDPTALPINRQQFNQLVQDITSALTQYQGNGAPDWQETYTYPITQTAGYPLYARVRYTPTAANSTPHIYESQVAGNTVAPDADNTSWAMIDASAPQVPTGTILAYGSMTAPAGYVNCDGSSQSTTGNLSRLFGVIQYAFGGSGSSFLLPQGARMTMVGAGGNAGTAPGIVGTTIGSTGGEESHLMQNLEVASHTHLAPSGTGTAGGQFVLNNAQGMAGSNTGTGLTTGGQTGDIYRPGTPAAAQVPFNIMQPGLIVNWIIKT